MATCATRTPPTRFSARHASRAIDVVSGAGGRPPAPLALSHHGSFAVFSVRLACVALIVVSGAGVAQSPFDSLRFRSIGPAATGGRIHDVEVDPKDPATIYVATASGGIWKTTNHATFWTPIFDRQRDNTFGDLAIFPGDTRIIWAGTGEQNNRQSTSWGGGVYRSTDAGATWAHVGLTETRHIGRVVAHPSNANIAYVAAVGNLWKPSAERGVFKT